MPEIFFTFDVYIFWIIGYIGYPESITRCRVQQLMS